MFKKKKQIWQGGGLRRYSLISIMDYGLDDFSQIPDRAQIFLLANIIEHL
jgi:hypothetical protein